MDSSAMLRELEGDGIVGCASGRKGEERGL